MTAGSLLGGGGGGVGKTRPRKAALTPGVPSEDYFVLFLLPFALFPLVFSLFGSLASTVTARLPKRWRPPLSFTTNVIR